MVTGTDEDFPPSSNFGRYKDLQILAKGGMGRVYKAYDPSLDRSVALKFLHRNDPQLRDRLKLEARAQAKIDHEHICKVYDVGEIDGKLYIAMQFIPGKTLHEVGHQLWSHSSSKAGFESLRLRDMTTREKQYYKRQGK